MSLWTNDFRLNYQIIKILGLWKLDTKDRTINLFYLIYKVFVLFFCLGAYNLLQYLDFYFVRSDLQRISLNLKTSLLVTGIFLSVLELLRKHKHIVQLQSDFKKEFQKGVNENATNILKEMKYLNGCFYGFGCVTALCWVLSPLLSGYSQNRTLPFPQWFPFDLKVTSNYVIAYTYQVISIYVFGFCGVSIFLSYCGCLIQIESNYFILEGKIAKISSAVLGNSEEKTILKFLKETIICHQQVLKSLKKIDDGYHVIVLYMVCAITICSVTCELNFIKLLVKSDPGLLAELMFVLISSSAIFFLAIFATKISDQSWNIENAAYNLPWYLMTPKHRLMISFIIAQAQREPRITAGKFLRINRAMFLDWLKLSYNLFMVFYGFME